MPDARRPSVLLALVAAVPVLLLPVLAATTPAAAEEPGPGSTVVGELVRGYADPEPVTRAQDRSADQGDGLLSWVQTAPGQAVRVPTTDVEAVPGGATVEVTVGGLVRDEATADGLEPAREVLAAEVVAAPEQVTAPASDPVDHEVTVVMLQPAGTARDTTTLAQVRAAVDGPVADFWQEQTDGAVRFGTVAGHDWPAGPATHTCADPFGLWQEAATRAGWTPRPNEHLLVYVPSGSSGCSYGLGTVGAGGITSGGLAYVRSTATSLIAHEFGHNLGLGHASQLQCAGAVHGDACQVRAYRDMYDVMGVSWEQGGSLGAPHAALLGTLPASTPTLAAGDPTTEFRLSPVGVRGGTRAVRLTDRDGDTYWLEYRTATGRDGFLGTAANWPGLQAGVLLRLSGGDDDTSLLLDGTPPAQTPWPADLSVAVPSRTPVSFGSAPFTVTVLEASASSARVEVSTTAVLHPLEEAYQRLGGAATFGAPAGRRVCGLRDGGCLQQYERGSISWTSRTGAHPVRGVIGARWGSLGRENGFLGYPVGGEVCGLRDGGCLQHFQGAVVYWSPASGAHPVRGAIGDRWARSGRERGPLGYPVGDEVCGLRDGGCFQQHQHGSIYWSPGTSARIVSGPLRDRWAGLGWEAGLLGYPVTDTACGLAAGGCFQVFQYGSLYGSAETPVRVVRGSIRDRWAASGWERGPLGYPVTDERCGLRGGGCFQEFQRGAVYWSPASGPRIVVGAIRAAWAAQRWESGPLGYPVGEEQPVPGGRAQRFQGGTLTWTAATGRVHRS